jgi:hypothetical protein
MFEAIQDEIEPKPELVFVAAAGLQGVVDDELREVWIGINWKLREHVRTDLGRHVNGEATSLLSTCSLQGGRDAATV